MYKEGPIVIIEDDIDDQDLFREVLSELNLSNRIVFFSDGGKAIEFLKQPEVLPFIILSDINMPLMTGFEFREIIHNDPELKLKCIPFIFCTTGASPKLVCEAYILSVQGVFTKPANYVELVGILKSIVDYWKYGLSPSCYV